MNLYTGVILLAIVQALVITLHLVKSDILDARVKYGFAIACVMIIVVSAAEWTGVKLNYSAEKWKTIHALVKSLEFSIAPVVIAIWATILSNSKRIWHCWVVVAINVVLEFVSAFAGFIFYINDENVYVRGNYYWIYIACYAITIIVLLIEVFKFSSIYQNRDIAYLIGLIIFLAIGVGLQLYSSQIRTSWIAGSIACTLLYIYFADLNLQADMVTKMLNRRCYENILSRLKYRTAIILFDVDDFKQVNDTYGHSAGDEILKKTGEVLRKAYGSKGLCFRTGGDEFCVILKKGKLDEMPGGGYCDEILGDPPIDGFLRSTPELERLNRRFAEALKSTRAKDPRMPEISFGYYIFDNSWPAADVVDRADQLMYENKRRRKAKAAKMNSRDVRL